MCNYLVGTVKKSERNHLLITTILENLTSTDGDVNREYAAEELVPRITMVTGDEKMLDDFDGTTEGNLTRVALDAIEHAQRAAYRAIDKVDDAAEKIFLSVPKGTANNTSLFTQCIIYPLKNRM